VKIFSEYFKGHLEQVHKNEKIKSEIWSCQEKSLLVILVWMMCRVTISRIYLEVLVLNRNYLGGNKYLNRSELTNSCTFCYTSRNSKTSFGILLLALPALQHTLVSEILMKE
jgi:hypothetical protein